MKLVTIENNEIRLSSNMDEMAFGKTNYNQIVTQTGIHAKCDSYSQGKFHFTFEEWSFSEVRSFDVEGHNERVVFYCGTSPIKENAKVLLDIEDREIQKQAYYIICSILTQASLEKNKIPVIGAGGIIINPDKENTEVLFLPENLYKYAAGGIKGLDGGLLHGFWTNPTLYDLPAVCFERSVYAYKLLTDSFPYSAEDVLERNADILDRKFLPVDMAVNNIDQELALNINKGLMLNSNEVSVPGKKKKGKSNEDLTPTAEFPLEKLYDAMISPEVNSFNKDELNEKTKNFLKFQEKRINTKRKIRRNSAVIITCSIVLLVLGIITANVITSRQNELCSIGLTSTQTIEAFYKGVNKRDTQLLENLVKGKEPRKYIDTISRIYVLGKQRKLYNQDQGFLSPEGWLLFNTMPENDLKCGVYGVSRVTIDGKESILDPDIYTFKAKPTPVTKENNKQISDKDTTKHIVEYFLLHTEGEDSGLIVERIKEVITLQYFKNCWKITDIATSSERLDYDSSLFKTEYYNMIKLRDNDPVKACIALSISYPWIPDAEVLNNQRRELEESVKDIFGYDF